MRKWRSMAALCLAVCMCTLLTCPVLAAEPYLQVVRPQQVGYDMYFDVYQIFTGSDVGSDFTGDWLVGARWGKNGVKEEGTVVTQETMTELQSLGFTTSTEQSRAVCDLMLDRTSEPYIQRILYTELVDPNVTRVEPGYYYIENTPGTVSSSSGYSAGIVGVAADGYITAIPKAGTATVEKYVGMKNSTGILQQAGTSILEQANQSEQGILGLASSEKLTAGKPINRNSAITVGEDEVVTFTLRANLPSNLFYWNGFWAEFEDVIPEGINVDTESIRVEWGIEHAASVHVDYETRRLIVTVATSAISPEAVNMLDCSRITVKYDATLDSDALVVLPNTNTVVLSWSNDPNEYVDGGQGLSRPEHVGVTMPAAASVYTSGVTMRLTDAKTGKPLADADFELYPHIMFLGDIGNIVQQPQQPGGLLSEGNGDILEPVTPLMSASSRVPSLVVLENGYYAIDGETYDCRNNVGGSDDVLSVLTSYDEVEFIPVRTDSEGLMVVTGLAPGFYRLHMKQDVPGYNSLGGDVYFRIDGRVENTTSAEGTIRDTDMAEEMVDYNRPLNDYAIDRSPEDGDEDLWLPEGCELPDGVEIHELKGWIYIDIPLYQGFRMPTAGGTGTAQIYAAGFITAVMGLGILVLRKRRAM